MSQDQATKHRYEHEAHEKKLAREDAVEEKEESELFLDGAAVVNVNEKTGERATEAASQDSGFIRASDVKNAYEMLPEFHHDDLNRIWLLTQGTHLRAGDVIFDLRNPLEGEQTAQGYETVDNQLFVSKKETDSDIWGRLLKMNQ